ncbi:MAG: MarR family winged helix-turn-helix transcriptional regulator [Calditrichaceae bacterium]
MELEKEIKQKTFKNEYQKMIVNIMFTHGWMNSLLSNRLKKYGISPQQFNILRILRGQYPEPARVNLLKDRMLDKMSNASRLVEKLRIKGLVDRHICENDRRAVDVVITQEGLDVLKKIDELEKEWEKQFYTLSPDEVNELNKLLDMLRG